MEIIKAPNEIRGGTKIIEFERFLNTCQFAYFNGYEKYELDLSDVIFMDSSGFRLIFNFLPIFNKVIPPKNQHIIDMYNFWLDSKKGLSKG
jgi:hypothetical protein